MANPAFINVTTLTAVVASAITTGQQVTIYDQQGVANRVAIEDLFSAMQTLSSRYAVQVATLTIPTAQVLTAFTTPIPFGITVPTGFIPVLVSEPFLSATYGTATYATNIGLRIRSIGGSVDITSDATALGFAANIQRTLTPQTPTSGIRYLDGTDLEVYVPTADPTTGDSDITVTAFYMLIPTPV